MLAVLLCGLFLLIMNIKAQTGCFTAGGNKDLYTMTGSSTTTSTCGAGTLSFTDMQTMYSKPAGCGWVPLSTSGTCKVNTPEGNNLCGIIGLYMLSCPVDNSGYWLYLTTGFIAFLAIRNRNFSLN